MKHYQVIIVGGGPAGAACAGKLVQAGVNCLVLDKEKFPRQKTCAGWITPRVFADLEVKPEKYPFDLTEFPQLKIYLNKLPITLPGVQYAIRRFEFDDWLLKSSGVLLIQHEVKQIRKTDNGYNIDGQYTTDYLVGAGGTHCPVYRIFFRENKLRSGAKIVALEKEYLTQWKNPSCYLWFFRNRLPGYAWYVPKKSGYLNIGVGGNAAVLKDRRSTIQEHWKLLVADLLKSGMIDEAPHNPQGYLYHLQDSDHSFFKDNVYLVGDSVGLATLDMGEGIGPAIRSGLNAAESILEKSPYSLKGISKYSILPKSLRWLI